MRQITADITAHFAVNVEVADDATSEDVKRVVVEACPKYPEVRAGVHFDPEDFTVLEDEAIG